MYASLKTDKDLQGTSTANKNNAVRVDMGLMRLIASGCWEKHYETFR